MYNLSLFSTFARETDTEGQIHNKGVAGKATFHPFCRVPTSFNNSLQEDKQSLKKVPTNLGLLVVEIYDTEQS